MIGLRSKIIHIEVRNVEQTFNLDNIDFIEYDWKDYKIIVYTNGGHISTLSLDNQKEYEEMRDFFKENFIEEDRWTTQF